MCHGKPVGMTIMVSNRLEKQLSREKIYTLNEPHFYEPTPHFLRDLLASLKISIEISQRTAQSNMILVKTVEDGRSQRQKITTEKVTTLRKKTNQSPIARAI